MKKERIVLFGDPVLRETALPVNIFHKKLHSLIDVMKFTLSKEDGGAALAANQVSVLKRITVIDYLDEYLEMINPEIISFSGENIDSKGCLSFPGFFGKVKRPDKIEVKYQDRYGKEHVIERSGDMARCIQHEVDHLNGILFIDRMEEPFISNGEKTIAVKDLLSITPGNRI